MNKLRVFSKGKDSAPSTPTSGSPSKQSSPMMTSDSQGSTDLSPELEPIVTLFSAQAKRRYNEGPFMLLKDLDSNGNPAERKWNEVFGILIGYQLTYWDSNDLNLNSKPNYINLSDSTFKICKNLQSANSNIENVIVLSTTLKNRFLLQFSDDSNFKNWYSSLRLAAFEYKCLQEAYTASLLSSRGSLLSNIKTILAEKKFNYEDWVSVRFGTGMPWKRCYAVIEPCKMKKKSIDRGKIVFYENEKKHKKSLMAVIPIAHFVYAVYPKNYQLIDQSTMIKLECKIQFEKKEDPKDCSVFIMPEQHSAVPGYDTLIRFIIPIMDSFALYGRPMKLKAYKSDPESLLFALPVLPNLYYLDLKDLTSANGININWSQTEWDEFIKNILQLKLSKGFTGIGAPVGSNLTELRRNLIDGKLDPMEYLINSPSLINNGKFPPSVSTEQIINPSQNSSIDNLTFHNANKLQVPQQDNDKLQTKKLQLTPTKKDDRVFDNSVSPQLVNIYTKYSQLPSNDLHNDMQGLNMKDNDNDDNDNLYPDDSDEEDADAYITKPNKEKRQQQRNLSPFTAFNSTFKESMQQNLDYHSQNNQTRTFNSNSSLSLPKQRTNDSESPLRNTIGSDNLYPTVDDEEDEDDNEDENVFSAKPAPSSNEDEFNFSPTIKQSETFTPPPSSQQRKISSPSTNQKISTSMFDEPVFNPYLKNSGSPHTPIGQQIPPPGPGPIKQQRHHSPNQFNKPPTFGNNHNKGSPKLPQGYPTQPPRQQMNHYGQQTNSPNLMPPHHYRQQQPPPPSQQQQHYPPHSPSSPVNQFMPQFPKQGLAPPVGGYQQQKQQYPHQPMYGGPLPPPQQQQQQQQQMGYRGAPLPPPQGYTRGGPPPPRQQMQYNGYQQPPPMHMHRKPPPGPNGGQVPSKSFKHDPYAIAKSS